MSLPSRTVLWAIQWHHLRCPRWLGGRGPEGYTHLRPSPAQLTHTLKPRALIHSLWASIRCPQFSSPFSMMLQNKNISKVQPQNGCSLLVKATELTSCRGQSKLPIRLQRSFCLSCPGQHSFGKHNIISKCAQVWSCVLKTPMKYITEFPTSRPVTILGKSRQGFVTQHKAVASLHRVCWPRQQPVANDSLQKQQNFSSKRPIQNNVMVSSSFSWYLGNLKQKSLSSYSSKSYWPYVVLTFDVTHPSKCLIRTPTTARAYHHWQITYTAKAAQFRSDWLVEHFLSPEMRIPQLCGVQQVWSNLICHIMLFVLPNEETTKL